MTGRSRQHHWRIAYASAKETDSHLRLLTDAGAIDPRLSATAIELFDLPVADQFSQYLENALTFEQ